MCRAQNHATATPLMSASVPHICHRGVAAYRTFRRLLRVMRMLMETAIAEPTIVPQSGRSPARTQPPATHTGYSSHAGPKIAQARLQLMPMNWISVT